MAVVADPHKLLLPDPNYEPSVLAHRFFPIFTTTLGFVSVFGARYMHRRPFISGIQQYVYTTGFGAAFGLIGQKLYDNYTARKDAIYRHYIQLHPEDFPVPERQKIGELFPMWYPIR